MLVKSVTVFLVGFSLAASAAAAAREEVTFTKERLLISGQTLNIEVARTQAQLERGLMYRKHLDDSAGMLFIYDRPSTLNFWMKNTFIPLSIGFFNTQKELVDIQDMDAVQSEMQKKIPTYESHGLAQYALEVNRGWFEQHKVKLKAKFKLAGDK